MKLNDVLTLVVSLLATQIQAGQIPIVGGVLGGVSTSGSSDRLSASRILLVDGGATVSVQRAPNHLRGVVENSGICG